MPEVTGQIVETPEGRDLRLVRSLALPIEEAWSFIADSERTALWFGEWEGDGRPGGAIRIRMAFEEDAPAAKARIVACEAPNRLALHTSDEMGSWRLELLLEADGEDESLLGFVHHLDGDTDVGAVGPGWEYYLDMLVAATEDAEPPHFDDYFPALIETYLERAAHPLAG